MHYIACDYRNPFRKMDEIRMASGFRNRRYKRFLKLQIHDGEFKHGKAISKSSGLNEDLDPRY